VPTLAVTFEVGATRVAMTALAGREALALPGGARVKWTPPAANEGVEEVRVRWRTTAGPGPWSAQLTFGLGSLEASSGKRYGDLLGLPAQQVEIELQPFREA